jgi:hypothetical protein
MEGEGGHQTTPHLGLISYVRKGSLLEEKKSRKWVLLIF